MLEKSSLYKLEKRLGLSAFGEYPDPFHKIKILSSPARVGIEHSFMH